MMAIPSSSVGYTRDISRDPSIGNQDHNTDLTPPKLACASGTQIARWYAGPYTHQSAVGNQEVRQAGRVDAMTRRTQRRMYTVKLSALDSWMAAPPELVFRACSRQRWPPLPRARDRRRSTSGRRNSRDPVSSVAPSKEFSTPNLPRLPEMRMRTTGKRPRIPREHENFVVILCRAHA